MSWYIPDTIQSYKVSAQAVKKWFNQKIVVNSNKLKIFRNMLWNAVKWLAQAGNYWTQTTSTCLRAEL